MPASTALKRALNEAQKLPSARRAAWKKKLLALVQSRHEIVGEESYVDFNQRMEEDAASQRSVFDRVLRGEEDADLALANELDSAYRAIADEASAVKAGIDRGIQDTGWAFTWPLGLLIVAALWTMRK